MLEMEFLTSFTLVTPHTVFSNSTRICTVYFCVCGARESLAGEFVALVQSQQKPTANAQCVVAASC